LNASQAPKTTGPANVGEAFAAQVLAHHDRDAVTIHRVGQPPQTRSYAELDRVARIRAAALDARLPRGSRVMIALPSSLEFVEAYLACLMSGMTAVPLPPPGGSTRSTDRIESVVRDCSPDLILTTPEDLGTAAEWAEVRGVGGLIKAVVPIDPDEPAPFWTPPTVAPQTPAVLQYSSGSTGTPRGVVLSHRNVLANTHAQYADLGLTDEDRLGSWIPMHHDMGLFFQLTTPVTHGLSCVLMPPVEFLKRPVEWLRMLDRYRITATSAPNFALDACCRVVTDAQLAELDLSRVRWVFNGSEPIHAPTQSAFSARFAAAGLREGAVSPAYGLAEATLFVCARSEDIPATVLPVDSVQLERGELRPAVNGSQLVGVGYPRSLEMRVVDPATRRALPDGRVGELWLRGESIGAGYWGRPAESAEIFEARIASEEADDRGWLRTGDLAAVHGEELFITGRIKEMMVLHGRNIYPQDLEHEARAAHGALTGLFGAAFSVPAPDERIVLVHEVDPKVKREQLPAVAAIVRERLSSSLGAPVPNVLLVRRGTVHRTTSGKIQRGSVRKAFLEGELSPVHADLEPAVLSLVEGAA
jgi:acyl-CoA synthetase (AMP-forming)/AMP-acid ligase II